MRHKTTTFCYSFITCMLLAVIAGSMISCTSTRYVTVPEVHTEYVSNNTVDIIRDTLIQRDSIIQIMKGDTVYVTKIRDVYHSIPSIKMISDTIIKTDTISKVVYVEKSDKLQTWWQRICLFSLAGVVFFVTMFIIKNLRK